MAAFWLSWQSKGKGWPWPHGQITSLWTRGRSKNKKVDLCQFLWKTLGNLLEVELLNAHSHAFQAHHLFFANFPTESPRSIHDARWTHHHSTSYNVYEKKSSKDQQSAPVQGSQKLEYYCWWKKSCTSWGPVVYPTIDRVLYIPSGLIAEFLFTINSNICSCYVTPVVWAGFSNHEINESDGNGTPLHSSTVDSMSGPPHVWRELQGKVRQTNFTGNAPSHSVS